MILAIDFGETTGYALSTFPKFSSGIVSLKESKKKPNKYAGFKAFLEETLTENSSINRIVYEDVKRHSNTAAAHAWGGYRAITEVIGCDNSLILIPINVKIVKKIFTNNGNASKTLILETCHKLGYNISDPNEADALAILSAYFKIQNSNRKVKK